MNKKILIVGGAGFIGHFIAKELLQKGHQVFIYDNFSNYIPPQEGHYPFYLQRRLEDIKTNAELIRGDIRDKEFLTKTIKEIRPEIVINLVAIPLANASNVFFEDAIQINLNGHINLLGAMRAVNSVERFIYTSSSFVYGHFKYDPADENHPTHPIDIYGGTKLSCEILTKSYSERFGVEYTIIRPSAVYGPTDSNRRVSQVFIENAIKGEPLILYNGGQDKVDFTYVSDAAHGFALAALSPKAKNEVFNITAGQGRSAEEFAKILDKLIPGGVKTIIKPTDEKKPIRGSLDIKKAKELLGYEPKYSLEDGLKEYIEYIKLTGLFNHK
ncbi:MAG: hypothetical protein A3A94_01135 [Candidatus Portnoybacteria bacterium RIFCSPLOWO2_01_FULL_43_11]|uniref:NAD-dependent epimerase/dehydratase domain-containing protein n=3 Tax=Bacteria candidate phyla TaxID=1783234 RepID=A0A1G2FTI6_9BACT|nr:MAG: hypothetical protein A2713_01730 [candidate division WWE3 bacterium RIFCSPHIGHO2_01_FULL_35_17]OGZ38113.1 MAG: hypothetical protein A3A94_01135 [Candidatus Portnoybacteria bacterium RIFCSPLOWO2_01_FULL_43_11]OGZ40851.1 MAG: hypothetical protein A3I20_02500 [Candidatus Portnoybacteria bacterium RIFCSPLOWO2_02_FULL_40_15]